MAYTLPSVANIPTRVDNAMADRLNRTLRQVERELPATAGAQTSPNQIAATIAILILASMGA